MSGAHVGGIDPRSAGAHAAGATSAEPYNAPSPDQPTPSEQQAATTSLGDLFAEVSRDVSTLMRQEVELAKAELKQSATKAGKGAGMFGGAALAGYFTLLFLSIALWWGLGHLIDNGWSAVVVALIWGIIGLVLGFALAVLSPLKSILLSPAAPSDSRR